MRVAAGIKKRMADEHGDAVEVGGHRLAVFPGPERVLSLNSVVGLPEEKLVRLKAIAEASLEGRLDAERLRGVPREEALADLNRIRGVGAWTAGHILVRGAGTIDDLALEEPRVLRAIAHSYGLTERPTVDEAQAIAELWRPFRTWVTVLLVVHLNRTGNWNEPSERTRAEGAARPSVPGRRSARSPRS